MRLIKSEFSNSFNRRYAYAYFSILTLTFAKKIRAFQKKGPGFCHFLQKSKSKSRSKKFRWAAHPARLLQKSKIDFCKSRILTLAKVKTFFFGLYLIISCLLSELQVMNHEAVEGAIDSTSYGSGSSRTNVQAMDQGAVEGDIDGASDGRSDRW